MKIGLGKILNVKVVLILIKVKSICKIKIVWYPKIIVTMMGGNNYERLSS